MDWSVNRSRWRKRSQRNKPFVLLLSVALLLLLVVVVAISLSSAGDFLRSVLPLAAPPPPFTGNLFSSSSSSPQECVAGFGEGERFLWYAPHSGFSNQLAELKNAILMAGILNRTLVLPPILDHHAVALGSCPKFRVASATQLRTAVWDHIMELVRERRYVSIGDIVDLSSVSMIRTLDFRIFASMWCGLTMDQTCFGGLCCAVSGVTPLKGDHDLCRSLLSGLQGNGQCVYAVEDDCRTTVWTYHQSNDDVLDSFQLDKELQIKKKLFYVRKRKDVLKALGHGSSADMSTVLAFGSLFSAPYKGSELYIDIHEAPSDLRIQSLLKKIEFLPFVPEIMAAGKEFALKEIRKPFLCAQLRLLDGQFKNHWKPTFSVLKQKLRSSELELKERADSGPIHLFLMTDLPKVNWTGTYLYELAKDTVSYKLYTLPEDSELVVQAAKKIMAAQRGVRSKVLPKMCEPLDEKKASGSVMSPDIRLSIEESICSCASLGFVGTAGSTIAENIELIRKNSICKL